MRLQSSARWVLLLALAAELGLGGCSTQPAPATSSGASTESRSRAQFAQAIAKIKPGMTAEAVLSALGPPGDKKTRDHDKISATRTVEVWRWGTAGHGTLGVLGTVHIQADHTVQYVFGGQGQPPAREMFDDAELERLLRILDAIPSFNEPNDPAKLVRAVNALQPLGKEKALAAIAEYLRVSSDFDDPGREGTFLVLRCLFDVPPDPGYMPRMMVGAESPPAPSDPSRTPRFPIVIVDDIPFSVIRGYILDGQAQPPESHLDWFRKNGVLRDKPLAPPKTPMETLEQMIATPRTQFMKDTGLKDDVRPLLLEQAMRLLSTVFQDPMPTGVSTNEAFQRVRRAYGNRTVRWDDKESRYVASDGSVLPKPSP